MTRRSNPDLVIPFDEPERELYRARRRLFTEEVLVPPNSPEFSPLQDTDFDTFENTLFATANSFDSSSSDFEDKPPSRPPSDYLSDSESEEDMAQDIANMTMEEYTNITRDDAGPGLVRPAIEGATQFELKGQFLKELRETPFHGDEYEDANEHVEKVIEISDMFHVPNVSQDQVMLRVFPITLKGSANRWLKNEPARSITTWEDLRTKFLREYCPPSKTAKQIDEIRNFKQEMDETLYRAWERYKELVHKCPQHDLNCQQVVHGFYKGLDVPTRQMLDSQGPIPKKRPAYAYAAIQDMATHSQMWHDISHRKRGS